MTAHTEARLNRALRSYQTQERPRVGMLLTERVAKKRLVNPELWRQLDAITNATYVNHLGRGHRRLHPEQTEKRRNAYRG